MNTDVRKISGVPLCAHHLFIAGLALLLGVAPPVWAVDTSIVDAGAIGDGTTLNTQAIQKAIDEVAAAGGGTLVIPKGIFLSGSIFLKPQVNLKLEKDAVLKGSTDIQDYPRLQTRIEGHFQLWRAALINADQADHLRIGGEGTVDGSGKVYWDAFRQRISQNRRTTNLDVERPRMFFIQNSNDVRISGIHLKDSGFWNLHLYRCRDVVVDRLDIQTPPRAPSTDGMDIDSSQNVTIQGCTISVGDDCIALKGSKGPLALEDLDSPPVEHIRVSNCTFAMGGGVVTLGSEATIVRDVLVEHCTVAGPGTRGIYLVRLKLRPDTPQMYEDIHFHDITLNGFGRIISIEPWRQYFDLQGHAPPKREVRDLTVSDVHGSFGSFGTVQGNPGDVIADVTLENIDVKVSTGTPRLVGIDGLVIKDVTINGIPYNGPPATRPSDSGADNASSRGASRPAH